jgi:lipopolysaccharide export system permease protein
VNLTVRHILDTFLRNLFYMVAGVLVLFILLNLFGKLDSFIDNQASLSLILRYYMNLAPFYLHATLPISMLLATLFTIGNMARYNELTALYSTGRSLLQISAPLLIVAVLVSAGSFAMSEYLLPRTNAEVEHIWEVELHGHPDRSLPTYDVPFNGIDGRLYYVRSYKPETMTIRDFRAVTFEGPRITERYDAETATWRDGMWNLEKGSLRTFLSDSESYAEFDTLASGLSGIDPKSFLNRRVIPDAMNARQLKAYIETIQINGGDPTEYRVDYHLKFAKPIINLIVVFLGILLTSGPRKTTVASGFGWTLMIVFSYYILISYGRALGQNAIVPPLLAAWVGNLFFGGISLLIFARIRR